ncbi:MAG: dihydrolipoyl dehydrogenase [Verrucomicrobiae bacterium]|nr:dihydrolipoyl dehydrogenase [Verrucomicrobiae bacterium]
MTSVNSPRPFDIVVLGGGPGGYAAALRGAQRGARVALVEAAALGGTCLNTGCIPTKAMLAASHLRWQSTRATEFGLSGPPLAPYGPAFMARVARTVGVLRKGVESLVKARRVELFLGRGKLVGPFALEVATVEGVVRLEAKSLILATGARPVRPGLFPWSDPRVQTSEEAAVATDLPPSVLIVGGGVIGCEFATIFSELGIPTTIVECMPRLLAGWERDVSQAVTRSLARRGVTVLTERMVAEVSCSEFAVTCLLDHGPVVEAARVIVALGRTPNTEGLGLEEAGVRVADGIIPVDAACRTNVPHIYAVGDVAEKRQFAHLAQRMGLVAADGATGFSSEDDRSVVPYGVYTHPEAASVGVTAERAEEGTRVASFPYLASGLGRACGETEGWARLVATEDGCVIGATFVGPHATELIQEAALAVRHKLKVAEIAQVIHAHPSFSEAFHEAAESWLGLPLHALK